MKTNEPVPLSGAAAIGDGLVTVWTRRAVGGLLVLVGLTLGAGGAALA